MWLSAIGKPNYNHPKNPVICSIHFKSNYFKSNGKAKRLKEDAIPTELISGSFNGTGLYCDIPAGFELQMYNYDQKLVFRKDYIHRNKKCLEVATEEFLKGRLVLLLEIERPLSISHVFSKQSVFYFIKLSALFFSPLMLYLIFNPSLLFLPVFAGEISLYHVFLFFDCFVAAAW